MFLGFEKIVRFSPEETKKGTGNLLSDFSFNA
jgi:hypothetical protein